MVIGHIRDFFFTYAEFVIGRKYKNTYKLCVITRGLNYVDHPKSRSASACNSRYVLSAEMLAHEGIPAVTLTAATAGDANNSRASATTGHANNSRNMSKSQNNKSRDATAAKHYRKQHQRRAAQVEER